MITWRCGGIIWPGRQRGRICRLKMGFMSLRMRDMVLASRRICYWGRMWMEAVGRVEKSIRVLRGIDMRRLMRNSRRGRRMGRRVCLYDVFGLEDCVSWVWGGDIM